MNCIKCGNDTKNEQIFCQRCLEVMEKYPVKSDVHVQLPNRAAIAHQKKSARKRILLSADEQVVISRKRVRKLVVLVILLILLLGAAVACIFHLLGEIEELRPAADAICNRLL